MKDRMIRSLLISSSLGLSACTVNSSDYNVRLNEWVNRSNESDVHLQSRIVPKYDYHFIWMGMREIDYLDRVEYRVINKNNSYMCAQLNVRSTGDADYDETHWNKSVVRDVTLIAPREIRNMGFYQLPRRSGDEISWTFDAFEASQGEDGFDCSRSSSDDYDCYITTAMCRDTGNPDDCAELQSLRKYRDEVMLKDLEGRRLVEEYYLKAPKIVSLIDQESDHQNIYKTLRERYITPAANAADAGENDAALALYREMVESLAQKYKSHL